MTSIVLGTNLKPEHAPLADVAALLAARLGAPLRLVHVSEDSRAPFVLGTDEEPLLGAVRSQLGKEARRLSAFGIDVHPHLAAGNVVDALLSITRFDQARLLVLGGESSTTRALLGSTAERAARLSEVPVLALREPDRLTAWLKGDKPLRLLVGADFGRGSDAARAFAAQIRESGNVEVDAVHVATPEQVHARFGLPRPVDQHQLGAEASEALLRELNRDAQEQNWDLVRVLAARGSADVRLTALVDQEDYDLVVVGQRRRSLIEQLWYGSVGRGVLRAAPVSVVCTPPRAAVSSAFREPKTVLVATDLTPKAGHVVNHALGFASHGATVHLTHVVPGSAPSLGEARLARERAWYALMKHPCSDNNGQVNVERHVLEGAPAEQLLTFADKIGADLLVLGATSQSPVSRALLGSVALEVSQRSKVPVLLVPAPTE